MARSVFELYLIKPSRYDSDGYPLQWWKTFVPSNSLASLYGIALDAASRKPLGEDVEIKIHTMDEINTEINPDRIIKHLRTSGNTALIGFVGVQSNQFPRAVDLARPFLDAKIPVSIGGFHVSGILAMLKNLPPDMIEARDMGISFFAGEAEDNRLDEVLIDAHAGKLKPQYGNVHKTPNLAGAPVPEVTDAVFDRILTRSSSIDLGRGCPFECSFCTIINVQGRKSRFRTADDLEKIIRDNWARGIKRYFVTDDNFARNKNWKSFTQRLIKLRREEGMRVHITIQIDTLAHKIDGFIKQCYRAGAENIFIGLESINADSLEASKKRQNRVEEYRDMFLAWKRFPVNITCGYIVGFPTDTRESILADIEIIKNNLPIDSLYLNYLTPLPGSADHKKLLEEGVWMDPDMNKYDLNNRVTHHPVMSDEEWEATYKDAIKSFYTWEHMTTVVKRMAALKSNKRLTTIHNLYIYRESPLRLDVSALESGIFRIYRRKARRHGMPLENPLLFYPKYGWRWVKTHAHLVYTWLRLKYILQKTLSDPKRFDYMDDAIDRDADNVLLTDTRMTEVAKKRMARNSKEKSPQVAAE